MQLNVPAGRVERTHEGAPAARLTSLQELRRSVLACLLWENGFYEDGQAIGDRITLLAWDCRPEEVAALAVEARSDMRLRHAPLLLLVALTEIGKGAMVGDTIARVLGRADEPGELLAIYWRDGRKPLAKQLKRGLALAMTKFDACQLAKYDRARKVRLRDVLFLTHAKPRDDAQAELWRNLVDGTLASPDSWEVALSAGADKRATFERLLRERKLGYLALLRNLRNMTEAGVDIDLMRLAIAMRQGAHMVLPFRFVAAARACPSLEPALDAAMLAGLHGLPALPGRAVVLVDVSGSMAQRLSRRSDLTRMDAAAALAAIVQGDRRVFTFSDKLVEVPARQGMAQVDAIIHSQVHDGTYLGWAVAELHRMTTYDRLIVITDEQSADTVPAPLGRGYMLNVGSYRKGVAHGPWLSITGFSENVLRFITAHEATTA